jgi:hypothetical protein
MTRSGNWSATACSILRTAHRIDSVGTQLTAGLSFSRAQQYARDHTAQEAIDTDITATAEGLVPLGTSYLLGGKHSSEGALASRRPGDYPRGGGEQIAAA